MSLNLNLGFPEIILRMSKSTEQRVYEFSDFRLDAEHLMLYQGGQELPLAPKAVQTLLALIERRGKIVSKDELLETVWPDVVVEESNLFLYLSILRKTLGTQKDGNPWVETLRRRGYRFNGEVHAADGEISGERVAAFTPAPNGEVSPVKTDQTIAENLPMAPASAPWSVRRSVALTLTCLAAAIGLAFAYSHFTTPTPITSIAVMPFANETGDSSLDYLAESMTETLVGKLGNIPDLQVKASSAVIVRYKDRKIDASTVGQELNVRTVLFGKLVKRGNDTALNLELVDAKTESSLWNHTYNKELSSLHATDGKLARELARKLNISLSAEVERKLARNYTENAEAYALFQKGRIHLRRLIRPEIEKGIENMQQAIDIDPSYALAYAGMSEAYRALGVGAEMPPHETLSKARTAALKAIEIDENLAEGHAALAYVNHFYDWDNIESEKRFQRALELDPNSYIAHFGYADLLNRMGRREESAAHYNRAKELEPLSPMVIVFSSYAISDPEKALEQIRFAMELEPNFYFSYLVAGEMFRRKKMYDEALAAYQMARKLAPDQTWSDATGLIPLLIETGRTEEARNILNEMLKRSESRFISPGNIAIIYKRFGDKDKALDWLERAYEQRDPRIAMIMTAPQWKDMREDPRFQDILRRTGF